LLQLLQRNRLLQLDDAVKSLKIVKGQFQRGGSVEYNKVQSIKDTLEGLSKVNPEIDKVVREVLFKLSSLTSEASKRVPAYAKLMKDNDFYFNQQTLLRDGVLSKIIEKVGGTS
jgi:hypothetical protein